MSTADELFGTGLAEVGERPAPVALSAPAPRKAAKKLPGYVAAQSQPGKPVTVTLPYPISANVYWHSRIVKAKATGKQIVVTHPTRDAQNYCEDVGWRCKAAGVRQPIHGRVRVDIALYPSRPQDWAKRASKDPLYWDNDVRCIDLDNANKVLLDALKGVAMEDDAWVYELHSQRMEPDGEARVVVTITPLVKVSPQEALL
jgi:crossover junction endodeoxyribonuclease RusA